jgi:hypothetical protein
VGAVTEADQRLGEAAQRAPAFGGDERGGRHECRHPLRRRPELAQASPAAQARAHVRAQDRELFRARLAVRERGQQRFVALALGAALDAGDSPQECLAPLGWHPGGAEDRRGRPSTEARAQATRRR